ncbi:MAG: hypothetical protein M3347_07695, partial [Armatimonadota bacterium]|nr:hypothetical protein [Armatimonadota bacterium]
IRENGGYAAARARRSAPTTGGAGSMLLQTAINVETRIEQTNMGVSARVKKRSLRLLEIVAPETAQAKVVEITGAAFCFGRDVVNGEIVSGQTHL